MGRMHAPGKGISGSTIPYSRRAPTWLKTSSEEAVDLICKLAKKGLTPSQIGIVLRDSHGVGLSHIVTGSKVVRVLRSNGTLFVAWATCINMHADCVCVACWWWVCVMNKREYDDAHSAWMIIICALLSVCWRLPFDDRLLCAQWSVVALVMFFLFARIVCSF